MSENSEELEVAYLIRGQKNIINRMKALIETARKEIAIFISYPVVLKELKESLTRAEERGVKLSIAMTKKLLKKIQGITAIYACLVVQLSSHSTRLECLSLT